MRPNARRRPTHSRSAIARLCRTSIPTLLITALALGCSDEASSPTAVDASNGTESGSATIQDPEGSTNAAETADTQAGSARESASAAPGPILDCVAMGSARPICKFQSPEDIVALPGDEALLISGYGAMGADGQIRNSGALYLFRLADESVETLYGGGTSADVAEAGWGDPTCPAPPAERFNAHGIDLVRRDDGRLALLVVQHFGREAIEFFEVTGAGTDWKLAWKGCVLAPPDASLNEVVGLPNGDFFTTKMASVSGASDFTESIPTEPTGNAFAWSAATGYRRLEGTDGIMTNGIAASPDGKTIYVNITMQNEVRKIDVASGEILAKASVKMPDNVTWAPDGQRLLIASLHGFETTDFGVCVDLPQGACPIPFAIQAVDAETMTPLGPVYESSGAPMGGGTVGLQVGNELFIGSFTGDRILRVALTSS